MKRVVERFVVLIVFGLSTTLLEYTFLRIMPASHFFDMQIIEPVKEVYSLWEKPKFATFAEYRKQWLVERQDIQYCTYKSDGVTRYYNQYISTDYKEEPSIVVWKEWVYNIAWPLHPAKCFIKNVTTMKLRYWIVKIDTVVTWPYYYWHRF